MRNAKTALFILSAILGFQVTAKETSIRPIRNTLSLDGTWQIADGKLDEVPTSFSHTVPVPGMATLASPPFADPPGPKVADRKQVPQKDPKREAFWYRRTFRLETAVPAVATLKVHKAMFGTRVLLNGQVLGDHLPCFTPGYFDAKSALKVGENELLIRVGADRDAVTTAIPSGFDYEKDRYIPGIFDSVELILSGTPHFKSVQTVPEIAANAVRIQARLRNEGEMAQKTITFVVREAKTRKVVGQTSVGPMRLEQGTETTVDARIQIAHCRLWSPEDPFLYTLEADSGADQLQVRFGMREFKFDPTTGRAILNGKPYMMRGSNFTVYRFFEDSLCRGLPWSRNWVRRLHERVKEMHWNCLRYCIGFPPEAWYDIADETGIMIQDEFPIWHGGPGWGTWPKELKSEELAVEYAEWMRERWNHPCVVIWDANNETASTEAAPAIRKVRDLDLSKRPWDNSYTAPMEPGDVFESHPYHFQNANAKLRDLTTADPVPQGNAIPNDGKHAVIINEYGWLWVNRDGTPTTLTQDLYRNVLGEQATPAQRFHLQATWMAADTEFWRMHRKAAAVVHFTTLGYSRPDGQTCDHWRDVEKLEWEPEFYRYVRDSFAPVGLGLDFWKDKVLLQTKTRIAVGLVNDLDRSWSGRVSLRLQGPGGKATRLELNQPARLAPMGEARVKFDLTWPKMVGRYTLEAELRGADGKPVRSVREFEVVDPGSMGLAFQKPVTASSFKDQSYLPAYAVDGDPATYWSSAFADPAWIAVDLGQLRKFGHVRITWEAAFSKEFAVETSRDGQSWSEVFKEANGKGGVSEIKFTPVEARHVRISCTKRATEWGHAIRELDVIE